ATTTRSATPMRSTRRQTRTTSGSPARSRSGFRGSLVAPRRAGITTAVFIAARKMGAGTQLSRHQSYHWAGAGANGIAPGSDPGGRIMARPNSPRRLIVGLLISWLLLLPRWLWSVLI